MAGALRAEGSGGRIAAIALRASMAWLGPGELVEDVEVAIERDRIIEVAEHAGRKTQVDRPPPRAPQAGIEEMIEVPGFLMPGAADRHVHICLSDPSAVVRGGVTAVRDLAWPSGEIFPLAAASEAPTFQGPLIRAAGPMITAPGGYPTRAGWAPPGTGLEVRGAEEAASEARGLLAGGAALLKVALNAEAGPVLGDEELVAVCDVAHRSGTIVAAHVQGRGEAARAMGAGVDEFAHCPWSERLPDDLIAAMARRARIVSTLDVLSFGRDTPDLRVAIDNLRRFLQGGGRVVYGTDLGNGPIPAGIHVGEAWHLYRAGMSPERILQALTSRPIRPGEPADLVALAGNPLEDLGALGRVLMVLRGGRRLA